MQPGFRLFPEDASTTAGQVDALYFFLLGVALFFTALICLLIIGFAVRYRKAAKADRSRPVSGNIPLELVWTVVPFVLAMTMFGWGAQVYFSVRQPPTNAMDIYVVAKQWMWKFQHPEGNREINELHVPAGQPIRLRMASEDVIHSFFVPAFRVKMDVLPGRYTTTWFEATKVGQYRLFCAEYCGTGHSTMVGLVVVQTPVEYERWLAGATADQPAEVAGEQLFRQFRCHTCHHEGPDARCPSLRGLLGRVVQLQDGRGVVADEAYLRESIVDPGAKLVAGYKPVMPTFKGQIGEEGIFQIIAYIKSLGGQPDESER